MKKFLLLCAVCLFGSAAYAQEPVVFTTEQDHQNMLDQLGIKSIRRGFDADQSSPYAANYDESKANPYPVIPELMKTNDGKRVKNAKQWYEVRRPEIVEAFESEVYGRLPENIPSVTWTVKAQEIETVGMMRVKAKQLVGHVDNSACPSINVDIKMVVVTPADAKGPVPLLMMFGQANLPNPVVPGAEDMAVINKTLRSLLESDPRTAELMKKYPAWQPFEAANPFAMFSRMSQRAPGQDPPSTEQLLAAGESAVAEVRKQATAAGFEPFLFGWTPVVDGKFLPTQLNTPEAINISKDNCSALTLKSKPCFLNTDSIIDKS